MPNTALLIKNPLAATHEFKQACQLCYPKTGNLAYAAHPSAPEMLGISGMWKPGPKVPVCQWEIHLGKQGLPLKDPPSAKHHLHKSRADLLGPDLLGQSCGGFLGGLPKSSLFPARTCQGRHSGSYSDPDEGVWLSWSCIPVYPVHRPQGW